MLEHLDAQDGIKCVGRELVHFDMSRVDGEVFKATLRGDGIRIEHRFLRLMERLAWRLVQCTRILGTLAQTREHEARVDLVMLLDGFGLFDGHLARLERTDVFLFDFNVFAKVVLGFGERADALCVVRCALCVELCALCIRIARRSTTCGTYPRSNSSYTWFILRSPSCVKRQSSRLLRVVCGGDNAKPSEPQRLIAHG